MQPAGRMSDMLAPEATQVAFSLVTGNGRRRGEVPCKGPPRIGAWGGETQSLATGVGWPPGHGVSSEALCPEKRQCKPLTQVS